MKSLLFLLAFITLPYYAIAQECNCEKDYDYVIQLVESNHPGFKRNVTKANQQEYQDWKTSIRQQIRDSVTQEVDCVRFIGKYLTFIKDKHLGVALPRQEEEVATKYLTQRLPTASQLESGVLYLKIPSFNSRLWRQLDVFYDSIAPRVLASKKIIVDLRNNGGGGARMYNGLLDLLKQVRSSSQVVVLFNRNCASACEEVALKVRKYRHVTSMGQNTYGALSYGFIKSLKTPNCGLTFIIPTRKYPSRLPYEYTGVPPMVSLDTEEDWVATAEAFLIE